MSWYKQGSVSVTNGSTVVTGAVTAWLSVTYAAESLQGPDFALYEIASVDSDTQLTLARPYAGTTVAGAAYALVPVRGPMADIYKTLAALAASGPDATSVKTTAPYTGGVLRLQSDKNRDFASIRDFGVGTIVPVGDGVMDVTQAVTSALASGESFAFPRGIWSSTQPLQMTAHGQRVYAPGKHSVFKYVGTGAAIRFVDVVLCAIDNLQITTVDKGINFDTSAGNTEYNEVTNCYIYGPGKGASRVARLVDATDGSTTAKYGVRFGPEALDGSKAVFHNTVRDTYIRAFDRLTSAECATTATFGGNANRLLNIQCEEFWTAHHCEAYGNIYRDGFADRSPGTSLTDYTLGYRLTANATLNDILMMSGEPGGNYSYSVICDAGSNSNRIMKADFDNWALGFLDNGIGNSLSTPLRAFTGMVENTYYSVRVAANAAGNTGQGTFRLAYSGYNATTVAQSGGEALFTVAMNAGSLIVVPIRNVFNGTGVGVPRFIGVVATAGKDFLLIFQVSNNGGSTGSKLNLRFESTSSGLQVIVEQPVALGAAPTTGFTAMQNAVGVNYAGNIAFGGKAAIAAPSAPAVATDLASVIAGFNSGRTNMINLGLWQ